MVSRFLKKRTICIGVRSFSENKKPRNIPKKSYCFITIFDANYHLSEFINQIYKLRVFACSADPCATTKSILLHIWLYKSVHIIYHHIPPSMYACRWMSVVITVLISPHSKYLPAVCYVFTNFHMHYLSKNALVNNFYYCFQHLWGDEPLSLGIH